MTHVVSDTQLAPRCEQHSKLQDIQEMHTAPRRRQGVYSPATVVD